MRAVYLTINIVAEIALWAVIIILVAGIFNTGLAVMTSILT